MISGETDAYVHAGDQYEWDSAAPDVVARRASLHTSRLDSDSLSRGSRTVQRLWGS